MKLSTYTYAIVTLSGTKADFIASEGLLAMTLDTLNSNVEVTDDDGD